MNETLDKKSPVPVWVPKGSSLTGTIAPGSGIVGRHRENGMILLYYEGNLYQAVNVRTFADRVLHAHARMVEDYPTAAMSLVREDEVEQVGVYDPEQGRVVVEHEERLAAWLSVETVPPEDLLTTDGPTQRLREMNAVLSDPSSTPAIKEFARRKLGPHR